ncbi:MAG: hydrogenase maturation protease [Actinobacteria bacterium]|nr:hydrogenase maturation protease [Actinomycetota bacterium]
MFPEKIKSELAKKLTGKVVILCVGSRSRGDDIFGPLVAKRISGKVSAQVIDAENVPENYLGKIAKLSPDVVLLVDAAHFDGAPGEIRLLDPQDLAESSFSTHSASLKLIEEFFRAECNSKVFMLAAQPRHVSFGVPPSPELIAAVDSVVDMLAEILN